MTVTNLQKPEYDIQMVWDPVQNLDLDHYEIWRSPFLLIAAVNQGTKKFTIDGLLANWFADGDSLIVTGSTGNDGTYTIATGGIVETTTQTVIEVDEAIPSSTADGWIGKALIDLPAGHTTGTTFTDKKMPVGGFYIYVVYAVDKSNNYSPPNTPITRWSPPDVTAPPTPTGLTARRTTDFGSVDLKWNDIEREDIAGYIIERTLDPNAGTPTWDVLAIIGGSKYKDSEIPINYDAGLGLTEVRYRIKSYDKSGNISAATAETDIFPIPTIRNVRPTLDFENINLFWKEPMPEDGVVAVAVYLRRRGDVAWVMQGVSIFPKNFFRIAGPLMQGTDYEIALALVVPFQIIELKTASDKFYILGDQTSLFTAGEYIHVYDSAGTDGLYEIDTVNFSSGMTDIKVVENITTGNFTINGLNQTYGYFMISGNHAAKFFEFQKIVVYGSTGNDGVYTVLSTVDFTAPSVVTRIYVQETIPDSTADGEITAGSLFNEDRAGYQVPVELVPVPNYEDDVTAPTQPLGLFARLDPENSRVFLNWDRIVMDNDFLEYEVDISAIGDFTITAIDSATDYFQIAGDQTAYFVTGQQIFVYSSTNNNGWYLVTNVTLVGGQTRIFVGRDINDAMVDGEISTDNAWVLMDKVKSTAFQAFFNYAVAVDYYFRVRAVDRSGNKSNPDTTVAILWDNSDIIGDSTFTPQWIDYSEQAYTTYKDANMRRYVFTVNAGAELSQFFRRYVLYFVVGAAAHATPWTLFSLTKDEIFAMPTRNVFTWETFQVPPNHIYIWPGVEDWFGNLWVGPNSSILEIPDT